MQSRAFLLLLGVLSAAPLTAEIQRWEMQGTLNYVNPLLGGTFTVGQTFSIGMDLDNSVPLTNGQRVFFYSSLGGYVEAISNGNVTFDNYSAGFSAVADHGTLWVRNTETAGAFGFDQIEFDFHSFEPGAVSAPDVDTFSVNSIEFNFVDESAGPDMIVGTEATFPAIDSPFPAADTFYLDRSTNSVHHFIIRFTGGAVEGTNFIRGTINSTSFAPVPEPSAAVALAGVGALGLAILRRRRA